MIKRTVAATRRLRALVASGAPRIAIARDLGVCVRTVDRWTAEAGIALQPRAPAKRALHAPESPLIGERAS